jgi:hypothetical protein
VIKARVLLGGEWSALNQAEFSIADPNTVDVIFQQAGDANEDGQFDQLDIVRVLQGGKYRTRESATWQEGDWNGDEVFDQRDIVVALQTANFLAGPYTARGKTVWTFAEVVSYRLPGGELCDFLCFTVWPLD